MFVEVKPFSAMSRKTVSLTLGCLMLVAAFSLPAQNVVQTAEEQALRLQEQSILMRKKMTDALDANRRGDFDIAAKLYEDALTQAGKIGPAVETENRVIVTALVEVRLKLAREAQKFANYTDADAQITRALKIDKNNPKIIAAKKDNDRMMAEVKRL